MRKPNWLQIVLLCSILAMYGCTPKCFPPKLYKLYLGPDLPRDRIAVVFLGPPLKLMTIDGQIVHGGWGRYCGDSHHLQLHPGPHTIEVAYVFYRGNRKYYSTTDKVIKFEAKAGRTYRIEAISTMFTPTKKHWWSDEPPGYGTWNVRIEKISDVN